MRKQYMFTLAGAATIVLASAALSQSTTSYGYDDLGRLKTVTPATGLVTNYCYDNAGNRTSVQNGGASACSGSSSSSSSSSNNHAPTCTNRVISTNMPDSSVNPATFTRTAAQLLTNCTDSDGDTLTVTTLAPYSVTIYANQTGEIDFTVSDGHGATANSAVVISRY